MVKKVHRRTKAVAAVAAATVAAVVAASVTMPVIASAASNVGDYRETHGIWASEYDSFDEVTLAGEKNNLEMAAEGFVLLKNENKALPLKATERRTTVLGQAQVGLAYGGGGSGAQGRPGKTGSTVVGAQSTIWSAMDKAGITVNPRMKTRYSMLQRGVASSGGMGGSNPADIAKYMKKVETGTDVTEFAGNKYAVDNTYSDFAGWDDTLSFYNDFALVVISRTGSEGADNLTNTVGGHSDPNEHYLELNDSEKEMMAYAKKNFKKIIVLINSPNVMEMKDLQDDDAVNAILWVGQPGWNGIDVVGDILTGKVNPSGRLVDFWMSDFTTDPTWYNFGNYRQANYAINGAYGTSNGTIKMGVDPDTAITEKNKEGATVKYTNPSNNQAMDYAEGIYMGYRYYETVYADMAATDKTAADAWWAENVVYPFGYGLSYTTFTQTLKSVTGDLTAANKDGDVTVTVTVENTGSVAGKEVVQVYNTAEYTPGGIEKAAVDLVGFAKTDMLAPGAEQDVQVKVAVKDLASYDYNGANNSDDGDTHIGYELEAGAYKLTLRKNSHEVLGTETLNAATQINWDNDDDDDTPNNIFSQTGNAWEQSNTLASNWTKSGKNHYMTRGTAGADNLSLLDFKGAVDTLNSDAADKTAAKNAIKKLAWLITDDNVFLDKAFNSMDASRSNNAATGLGGFYNGGDRDWDNPMTVAVETNYKNLWTKQKSDIPTGWTQAATAPTGGKHAKLLESMIGVDYDDEKWDAFMNQLTWDDLKQLVKNGGYRTTGNPSIDAPTVTDQDGPGQLKGSNGNGYAYVCEVVVASTWNTDLAYEQGRIVGNENMWIVGRNGINNGWYGPAMNTHRNPLAGRNFEYYSQDGLQGGKIAAAVVGGAVDMGCHVYIKHIFMNDQETSRSGTATFGTEQAIRLIYARPFEIAIKEGRANGVMNSFNRIGLDTSASYVIANQLYTNEWGYVGLSVTDYYSRGATGWSDYQGVRGLTMALNTGYNPVGEWKNGRLEYTLGTGDSAVKAGGTLDAEADRAYWTQWYWTRELAKRVCYNLANTAGFQNGFNTTGKADTNIVKAADKTVKNMTEISGNIFDSATDAKLDKYFGNWGYSLTAPETIPAGLKIAADGTLSGTITALPGVYELTFGLAGNGGLGMVQGKVTVKLTVEAATNVTLSTATGSLGKAYTGSVALANNFFTADNYVENGDATEANMGKYVGLTTSNPFNATGLPEGLTINKATGEITGTPTEAGVFNVVVSRKVQQITQGRRGPQKSDVEIKSYATLTIGGGFAVSIDWGTGATDRITATEGGKITGSQIADLEAPTRKGYELVGFKAAPNDKNLINLDEASYTESATLYAVWEEIEEKTIVKTEINDKGELEITYSNGDVENLGVVIGADGENGKDGANGTPGAAGKDGVDGAAGSGSAALALAIVSLILALGAAGVAVFLIIRRKKD